MAKKSRTPRALDLALPIYQVKITLQHIQPPIWRRIQTDDCSLDELHDIIQACMGWEDEHTYAFVVADEEYGDPRLGSQAEQDSQSVRLSELAGKGHTRFRYDYDFGDDWRHVIDIEKTLPAEEGFCYPRCVDGKRACPPENSGGPYGYPRFLDTIQDADHDEQDDILEWDDGEFDPEKLDLSEVNDALCHLRRWLGYGRGLCILEAAFADGDLVCVKPGTVHDRYSDIPLGGWVGRVERIRWLTPISYTVCWTQPTLEQAHAVFFKRCQRDEMKPHEYWPEEDQLELASDETPVAMQQPTNLVTRPLSMKDPNDRIRSVFGMTSDDALPRNNEQTQRHFLRYLETHLSFPFLAEYCPDAGFGADESAEVSILGLADSLLDGNEGIVCKARQNKHKFEVPLHDIQIEETDPNSQYVDDYIYWLWEAQDYDLDDDDVESSDVPIGTIAYYGPDDKTTTKIAAGVFNKEGAKPIIKRWVATDVMTNPKVQGEIEQFFKTHGVTRVGMSEGNLGCPHEEGKDFPDGGDCPFCPWWKGKQGSGASE